MKRRKLLDIIISIFLISSLGLTAFIVSCSDQDIISSYDSDQSSPYHQHIHGVRGPVADPVTAIFEMVGQGAARELGSVGMGWALGAIGLTGASGPNWEEEFNTINTDLSDIISLLNEADNELASINTVLNEINCSQQSNSLQEAITAINVQLGSYNKIMESFNLQDTAQYQYCLEFANMVINGSSTQYSIPFALNEIVSNMTFPTGNVISACLGTIQNPANGTFRGDSIYYVGAQSVLNYYYYYQTIGLGLLSEAYHWQAWVAAGAPGAGSGYSADSIQNVCNDNSAKDECVYIVNQTNIQYNTLLGEFKQVGAPYTGEDLIYQKNVNGENVVWVRSLEDYTAQSGANCNYPLNINNFCGPTFGKHGSTLSATTYYGTQNFTFPSLIELNGLVDPTPTTSGTVGYFLDSVGFENMNVSPPKVLIADTLVKLVSTGNDFNYYIDTMSVIPYISPGYPPFTVENSHNSVYKRAIYSQLYDFIGYNQGSGATAVAMYYKGYTVISNNACQDNGSGFRPVQTNWYTAGSANPWGGINGYSGYIQFCQDQATYNLTIITPFTWVTGTTPPGWSYYSRNSSPQNAFFIPVRTNFSGSTGCLPGYHNLNLNGNGAFITLCGEDFQNFLNLNLPAPPTCDSTNFPYANPMCVTLP